MLIFPSFQFSNDSNDCRLIKIDNKLCFNLTFLFVDLYVA